MDTNNNHASDTNIAVMAIVTAIAISICVLVILVVGPCVKYLFMHFLRLLLPQYYAGLHQPGPTAVTRLNTGESASTGLDPTLMISLPAMKFHKEDFAGLHKAGESAEILECVVCLCMLEEGDLVRILPNCSHFFHVCCIDKWLSSHDTCPICRADVRPITGALEHVVEIGSEGAL